MRGASLTISPAIRSYLAKSSGQLPNIARNIHYVPQATLRRWSDADGRVDTYALLVPHHNVPL